MTRTTRNATALPAMDVATAVAPTRATAAQPLPPRIRALGPMHVRTYRTPDNRYDIDISQLPGGVHYAEISRKAQVADAYRMRAVLEADLSRAGIETCADRSSQAASKLRFLLRWSAWAVDSAGMPIRTS